MAQMGPDCEQLCVPGDIERRHPHLQGQGTADCGVTAVALGGIVFLTAPAKNISPS